MTGIAAVGVVLGSLLGFSALTGLLLRVVGGRAGEGLRSTLPVAWLLGYALLACLWGVVESSGLLAGKGSGLRLLAESLPGARSPLPFRYALASYQFLLSVTLVPLVVVAGVITHWLGPAERKTPSGGWRLLGFTDSQYVAPEFLTGTRWLGGILLTVFVVTLVAVASAGESAVAVVPAQILVMSGLAGVALMGFVLGVRPDPAKPSARSTVARAVRAKPPESGQGGFVDLLRKHGVLAKEAAALMQLQERPARLEEGHEAGGTEAELQRVFLASGNLYTHQAAARDAVRAGKAVLLAHPPGSGLSSLGRFVSALAACEAGARVLVISADGVSARAARTAFDEELGESAWRWALASAVALVDLADRFNLSPPPAVVFSDLQGIHADLLRHAERDPYRRFLANLRLVVIEDIDAYSGTRANHLAYLYRRLEDRAMSFAGGPPPAVLVTSGRRARGLEDYVGRILGRPLLTVDEDGSPGSAVHAYLLPQGPGHWGGADGDVGAKNVLLPAWCVGSAAAFGLRTAAEGFEQRVTRSDWSRRFDMVTRSSLPEAVQDLAPTRASDVSVLYVDAGSFARRIHEVDHVQSVPGRSKHVSLWLADSDAFTRYLLDPRRVARTARDPGSHGGSPVVTLENDVLARPHFLAAIREARRSRSFLDNAFGQQRTARFLAELDTGTVLRRDTVHRVDPSRAALVRDEVLRAAGDRTERDGQHLDLSGSEFGVPLVEVFDEGRRQSLLRVHAERARAIYYPQRVFMLGGERYRVMAPAEGNRLPVSVEPQRLLSTPVRQAQVIPTQAAADYHQPQDFGGTSFQFFLGRFRLIVETFASVDYRYNNSVYQKREFSSSVQKSDFDAVGRIVMLPSGMTVSDEAMHTVTHAFRLVLPALVWHDEDDLYVTGHHDIGGSGQAGWVFSDLHPGGVGFGEAIDVPTFRALLFWSKKLLESCQCQDACWSCCMTLQCHRPSQNLGLNRHAGAALIRALLPAD